MHNLVFELLFHVYYFADVFSLPVSLSLSLGNRLILATSEQQRVLAPGIVSIFPYYECQLHPTWICRLRSRRCFERWVKLVSLHPGSFATRGKWTTHCRRPAWTGEKEKKTYRKKSPSELRHDAKRAKVRHEEQASKQNTCVLCTVCWTAKQPVIKQH